MSNDRADRPVPGAAELKWEKLAKTQEFVQLEEVRATANQWRTGLTAITGLLAVAFSILGPPGATTIEPEWRHYIVLTQAGALALLAFGLWKAMHAAFGTPAAIHDTGVRLREWTRIATQQAAQDLAAARWFTLLGFLVLAAAMVLAGLAPPTRDSVSVLLTDSTGARFCGTLSSQPMPGTLEITAYDGTVYAVEIEKITALAFPDQC